MGNYIYGNIHIKNNILFGDSITQDIRIGIPQGVKLPYIRISGNKLVANNIDNISLCIPDGMKKTIKDNQGIKYGNTGDFVRNTTGGTTVLGWLCTASATGINNYANWGEITK